MTTETTELRLTGLDALDPLAYLATLGCLQAVSDHCRREGLSEPRLAFDCGAEINGKLSGPFRAAEALVELLANDLELIAGRRGGERDPFLAFKYEAKPGKTAHDLKPPPGVFRAFASELIDQGCPDERRTLDWMAAVLTDVAVDNSGNSKPFALHFTAGQQQFLTVALELLDGLPGTRTKRSERPVDAEDLRAAVFGPWRNDRDLKVFSWSPAQDRAYALRAVDPSGDKKQGTPGADWLALRALPMLSSAPVGDQIKTSGTHGSWKHASFSYPIWKQALDADAARSLLRHPAVQAFDQEPGASYSSRTTLPPEVEILTCRVSRSDQGGYGAFSRPSRR